MNMRTRWSVGLVLAGISLLVVAHRYAGQLGSTPRQSSAAAAPGTGSVAPSPGDLASGQPPTIFEALLSVLDSTEEGRAIDEEQRKQLREELINTNKFWKNLKVEMKEGVREANRTFQIDPNRPSGGEPVQPAT